LAGSAKSALQSVMLDEGCLQCMEDFAGRQPLDGSDLPAICCDGEYETRIDSRAAQPDCAGAE
jgi:hypothetical protein